ncbi:RNA degradosome polyphosphate kinase [Halanaerobacter jeridensis]|uniref:Polyphosphate kinase n=1 Tax=Halanaerobacter jeridensis TaxID=706427 RepID=A0A938XR49_9FIRM|nr:RNA degradosome polyphosphate kinase [Halanaerobacter jeridensis]MBM7555858.1 polyphosphate kinase [Halanaerobacter jeridensis]
MDYGDPEFYISKQFGWVEFNKRVLEEAQDDKTPLLERLKFLSITASNLDEFVMVRVARLKDEINSGYKETDKAGLTPKEIFAELSNRIHDLVAAQYQCWNDIVPKLEEKGIHFAQYEQLDDSQQRYLDDYFNDTIQPVLTPRAIDQSRPFPVILNKSLNLAVRLKSNEQEDLLPNKEGQNLFSVVRVPAVLPRIVEVPAPDGQKVFIFLEKVIEEYLDQVFSGYEIEAVNNFRITRNADVDLDEDARNLLVEMERYVKRREKGFPVRLEIEDDMDENIKKFLVDALDLSSDDVYEIDGPIDLSPFFDFRDLEGYQDLRFEPHYPEPAIDFHNQDDIFAAIRKRDRLLHVPYESFDPIVDFVKEAAHDPNVLAIKQTLYRVSGDSPIIDALAKAAENGKQVTVLVELKARFDEKNNIEWAKKLEAAGCHVVYGLVGLKVHSKLLLVVRQESDGIRRYAHLSTGNYNDKTAKTYTDVSMFSCREPLAADVSSLFNLLTGYSKPPRWRKLSVAPLDLRETFINWIRNEVEQVKSGKEGHIIAKMNALVDKKIIKELYKAASEGVKIDLIVRGMSCLRPGIEGVSENIRVISIVGQLLEHSRVYYFANGGQAQVFLSSADWRPRNLDRRVEALFPVENEKLKKRIIKILRITLKDTVKAREQQPDGSYERVNVDGEEEINSQEKFRELAKQRLEESQDEMIKKFEPKLPNFH